MKIITQSILYLICLGCIAGCIGPKVPAYKTKTQKFNWGKAYVWMSTVSGTRSSATSGEGYLLIDTYYKKRYRNKSCALTVDHVSMTDPKSNLVLIEQTPLYSDGSPMTRKIDEYRSGQFSLSRLPFEFDKESFPYDLNIKIRLNCPNKKTEDSFSRKIEFQMVQPVLWEQ